MFQLGIGGLCGSGTCDEHDPQAGSEGVLMQSDELAQAPPDTVSHHRITDSSGSNESGSERLGVPARQHPENEQRATVRGALILHAKELSRAG